MKDQMLNINKGHLLLLRTKYFPSYRMELYLTEFWEFPINPMACHNKYCTPLKSSSVIQCEIKGPRTSDLIIKLLVGQNKHSGMKQYYYTYYFKDFENLLSSMTEIKEKDPEGLNMERT